MNKKTLNPLSQSSKMRSGLSIMQRVDDPNLKRAKKQLHDDIANGATGVALIFEGANNAYGFGLPTNPETFSTLFDDIELDGLHIRLDNHPSSRIVADSFIEYLQHRHANPNRTKITFSIDPTAVLATTGKLKMSIEALKASLPQSMSGFFSSGIPGIVLEADGRPYHNAGAPAALEVGAMLSVAFGHIKMVENARHHIIYALPHIGFAMALTQDPQLSQIKIAALHKLWHRLQEECGISSTFPAIIHAETSMRMMSKNDSYNNISRASYAAYAAFSSEVSSLSILPHSFVYGLPDANARRIARNNALILSLETSINSKKHHDDYKILVDEFANAAWLEFKALENEGGILQSLIDGHLAKRINEAREAQLTQYHNFEKCIIGSSLYAIENQTPRDIIIQEPQIYNAEGITLCQALNRGRLDEEMLLSPK